MSSMLEYSKIILNKVSFNKALFEKELAKALGLLTKQERQDFLRWCVTKFNPSQYSILKKYSNQH